MNLQIYVENPKNMAIIKDEVSSEPVYPNFDFENLTIKRNLSIYFFQRNSNVLNVKSANLIQGQR